RLRRSPTFRPSQRLDLRRLLFLRNRHARTRLESRPRLSVFPFVPASGRSFLVPKIQGENCEQLDKSPRLPEDHCSRRRCYLASRLAGTSLFKVTAGFYQILRL